MNRGSEILYLTLLAIAALACSIVLFHSLGNFEAAATATYRDDMLEQFQSAGNPLQVARTESTKSAGAVHCVYGLEDFAKAIDRLLPSDRDLTKRIRLVTTLSVAAQWQNEDRNVVPPLNKRQGTIEIGNDQTRADIFEFPITYVQLPCSPAKPNAAKGSDPDTCWYYRVGDSDELHASSSTPRLPITPDRVECADGEGFASFSLPIDLLSERR